MLFRRWAAAVLTASALLVFGAPAAPAAPGPGLLVVEYRPAQTQEDAAEQEFLQDNEVLESAAAHVNDLVGLPGNIPLVGVSCDEANAAWDPETQSIYFCYGYAGLFRSVFAEQNTDGSPAEQARATDDDVIGFSNSTVFHEFAHALIDVYDLPVTGREEDAADQLSALLLSEDSLHQGYAVSAIEAWAALAQATEQGDISAQLADEHSLSSQRFYNTTCWLYGSDPELYRSVVLTEDNPGGFLPADRAARCPAEYQQMLKAWGTLLAPYLKQQ
ncbi:DUF4344 domain-containing metallopeptidase [Streptomyces sp. NPDC096079]|uniref:DUF4344 domain-containing metallopeptidase n=1 Tax=Streptomyces sp. NPDC096079 TaxID=3155820 RepID=UPI003316FAE2